MPHSAAGPLLFEPKLIKLLAEENSTPLFLYSKQAIFENVTEIRNVLSKFDFTIYYALKANRYPPVIDFFKKLGVHIDCCSPTEVQIALDHGFSNEEISVTGCFLSNKDLKFICEKNVHINLDGFSQIERYSHFTTNNEMGLRIDTKTNSQDWAKSVYNNSKFGISFEELPKALALIKEKNFRLVTLHCHIAWNMSKFKGKDDFENALKVIVKCAKLCPDLKSIDVGGGLGIKFFEHADEVLSSKVWADLLEQYLLPLNVKISCELGTKLMANAGILVTECTTIQQKNGINWLGLNCGFNLNGYAAHYGIKQDIVNIESGRDEMEIYNIGGNLNEGIDVFHEEIKMKKTREGDLMVILYSGAYCVSMSSNHCGRGQYVEMLL